MANDLPYLMSNKRLPELISQIQSAGVPDRVTFEFLKKLGFTSSTDRALVNLLKKLGFVDPAGSPTERYRALKHRSDAKRVIAEAVRELYSDLFALNEKIHSESKENVRGAVGRLTGAEERYVNLMASTFQALASLGDFDATPVPAKLQKEESEPEEQILREIQPHDQKHQSRSVSFRNNIEIHLPATTDIAVYNAIFKSLKEHLL